jgi:multiple sugar transport system substrate-binding protein
MIKKLKGMTWDHPRAFDPLVATAKGYAREHDGVEISWDKRSLQSFADHPIEDLAARYDLIVIDHPHIGTAATQGCLVALDQTGRDAELAQLARQSLAHSHTSYQLQGHQWALAIDAAAQVAAYRSDLIKAADLPGTWDQVLELASLGKVLWPLKPVDSIMSFFSLAANRGTPCAAAERLIDRADGIGVLEMMGQIVAHLPPICLSMNPIQTLEQLAADTNALYCPLLFGYINYARPGFRQREILFTDIPSFDDRGPSGAILGGTGMAVSSNCTFQKEAVDYTFWIAGADCQRGPYFEAGGQPANVAAWDDPTINAACNHFFQSTRATLEKSYLRPRYDGYLDLQEEGGYIIHAFLTGRTDAGRTIDLLEQAHQTSRKKGGGSPLMR